VLFDTAEQNNIMSSSNQTYTYRVSLLTFPRTRQLYRKESMHPTPSMTTNVLRETLKWTLCTWYWSPLSHVSESSASCTRSCFASHTGVSRAKKKQINDAKGKTASNPATVCQWRYEPREYTSRIPAEKEVKVLDE